MNLYVLRTSYSKDTTMGNLIVNDKVFCYTLEDVVRAKGAPKVNDETAIPAGRYEIIVNFSDKFKRQMPLLLNVPGFTGIRMHGGNTSVDTSGCLLCAYNKVDAKTIQGTAEKDITKLLLTKPNEKNWIEIIDTFPYKGI